MGNKGDILTWVAWVSILVFVELALDGSWNWWHGPYRNVSILVFVELALDVLVPDFCLSLSRVSILVFVELALDAISI